MVAAVTIAASAAIPAPATSAPVGPAPAASRSAQAAIPSAPRSPRRRAASRFDWPRTSPEAQGLDSGVLDAYRTRIAAGEWGPVDSLLVIRHGALVAEEYFGAWDADTLHRVYSVTKSVTSLLYGIGLDRGVLPATTKRVVPQFPEYTSVANLTLDKRNMTIDDLLTMRAGFAWNELSVPYSDPSNIFLRMVASPDWIKFVLDQPMEVAPGTRFRYNTGATVLLGGIIRNATGRQPADLGDEWLFAPLEISSWRWDGAPPNVTNTGSGLWLRPLDMARIGQLVLHRGAWRGLQLVPADWVQACLTQRSALTQGFGYGSLWWRMPLRPDSGPATEGNEIWLAWGYGGQFIFVVPELDAVVVSTASCDDVVCEGAVDFIQDLLAAAVTDQP